MASAPLWSDKAMVVVARSTSITTAASGPPSATGSSAGTHSEVWK